jgi:hypothetical protein
VAAGQSQSQRIYFGVGVGIFNWAMRTGMGPSRHPRRAGTFKRVAETGPRLASVVGKGRLGLVGFLPEV